MASPAKRQRLAQADVASSNNTAARFFGTRMAPRTWMTAPITTPSPQNPPQNAVTSRPKSSGTTATPSSRQISTNPKAPMHTPPASDVFTTQAEFNLLARLVGASIPANGLALSVPPHSPTFSGKCNAALSSVEPCFAGEGANTHDSHRFLMLKEAVKHRDIFFIVLNQMQCFAATNADFSVVEHGLKGLAEVVDSAEGFSSDFKSFSTHFPVSRITIVNSTDQTGSAVLNVQIAAMHRHISACSGLLTRLRSDFVKACRRLKILPLAQDLARALGLSSQIIQRTLFGQIARQVCETHDDADLSHVRHVFTRSQDKLMAQEPLNPSDSLAMYQEMRLHITGHLLSDEDMVQQLQEFSHFFTVTLPPAQEAPPTNTGQGPSDMCPSEATLVMLTALVMEKRSDAVVYVRSFALHPSAIRAKYRQKFEFQVEQTAVLTLAERHLGPDSQTTMSFAPGGSAFRLRCCKPSGNVTCEGDWLHCDITWPDWLYVTINNAMLPLPRTHRHSKKTIAYDVSDLIGPGTNTIVFHLNRSSKDTAPSGLAVGIELIKCSSIDHIIAECISVRSMPAESILAQHKAALLPKPSDPDDDDLVMLDPTLTIPLFEPFSNSKIFQIPARGKGCKHTQPFDLRIWLETRASSGADFEIVDAWRCPICRADARPHQLVIDGFLMEVREELARQGKLDTRAITVDQNGKWKIKEESQGRVKTDSPAKRWEKTPNKRGSELVVMEIID